MKYKRLTNDGELITGDSPTEILTTMRDGSRFWSESGLEEYLDALVIRINDYYGTLITSRDHGEMVDEMITIGYLKPVE